MKIEMSVQEWQAFIGELTSAHEQVGRLHVQNAIMHETVTRSQEETKALLSRVGELEAQIDRLMSRTSFTNEKAA